MTLTVQVESTPRLMGRVVPQVLVWAKLVGLFPVKLMALDRVKSTPPELVRVTVFAALCVLSAVLPKLSGGAGTVAAGVR